MTDDNKTHRYYIVKWDRPPHEFQEDDDIFQAVDVFCNSTYLNPIQQEHHWYNQNTIKTVFHVQHVFAENIDLQKPYLSIKLTNTCNCRKTVQKGSMKLPDIFHKCLMYDITCRGALDFINHDKYVHQDEEEESNNYAYVLSPDEEK